MVVSEQYCGPPVVLRTKKSTCKVRLGRSNVQFSSTFTKY